MSIIISSDWHVGDKAGSEQHNQDLLDFTEFLIQYSVDNNITQFAHLGDFFHNRDKIDVRSLYTATKIVNNLNKRFGKYIQIIGNHDLFLRDSRTISSLEIFRDKITLVDDIMTTNGIMFVSWLTSAEEYDNLINLSKKHDIKYILGHFEFQTFRLNDSYIMEHGQSHKELSHIKKIYSGHFHMRQNKDNVQYIGSPFPFSYSDANDFERGFTVLHDDGKEEFVQYDHIHILSIDYKDFLDNDLSDISNKSIRLIITEDIDDETLNKIKAKLELEVYRDTRILYQVNKQEEVLNQETDVSNVESVDDVVKQHLTNMSDVDGVDNKLLLKLYDQSIC